MWGKLRYYNLFLITYRHFIHFWLCSNLGSSLNLQSQPPGWLLIIGLDRTALRHCGPQMLQFEHHLCMSKPNIMVLSCVSVCISMDNWELTIILSSEEALSSKLPKQVTGKLCFNKNYATMLSVFFSLFLKRKIPFILAGFER